MKPPSRSEFDSTRWSLIEMAGAKDGSQRRTALDKILSAYLPALQTYLMLNRRVNAEEAEDLLHDFVTDKILQGDLLSRADHTKGRFRSLLIKSLNNYLVDRYRSRRRKGLKVWKIWVPVILVIQRTVRPTCSMPFGHARFL